jgi:rhodanese-related sulfurtransferase
MNRNGLYVLRLVMCLLLALGVAAGASGVALAADLFEKETEKEKEAVKLVRDSRRGGYDVVSAEELKELIAGNPELLVIDTMPFAESYKKEHVPGARQFLFPIPDMPNWDPQQTDGKSQQDFLSLLGPDKERPIVFYCGFVKCTRSHNGAAWATQLGYRNVLRFAGGLYAWKGAGYPVAAAP